jgi:hypothetical protein
MTSQNAAQIHAPLRSAITPAQTGILQRACACGNHHAGGGECENCKKKNEGAKLQHAAISTSPINQAPSVDPMGPNPPLQALGGSLRGFAASNFGGVLSEVRDHSNANPNPGRHAGQSGQTMPFLDTIQRSFGRHDVSHIRAHTDLAAASQARKLGAEAFAHGSDVTFLRAPSLYTAAHEAAHVIQQRAGVQLSGGVGQPGDVYEQHADKVAENVVHGRSSEALLEARPGAGGLRSNAVPTQPDLAPSPAAIQMRRIPPNVRALLTSAAGGDATNFTADSEGAQRLIERAMSELDPADQAKVITQRRGALSEADFNALPLRERLSKQSEAIIALFPDTQLGDPALIDTGARPLTADTTNINTLVTNADAVFGAIASGAQDDNIKQVFGAANLTKAKTKYANGRSWMNKLRGDNKIVTDRSGYTDEVSQGGLTGFHKLIRLSPGVIDTPDDNDSIITAIHESMHAGNDDVKDDLYITATGFQSQPAAKKLTNSAHFEVVPWRFKDATNANAFPITPLTTPVTFQTFIPAGTTVGGVTAPALTTSENAVKAAYVKLNNTWALGLNLHLVYVQLFRTPTDWTKAQPDFGGVHFNNSVPFWSKVQKLTIHQKTVINPASALEAEHPVSQIDVALSEGFTRKFSFAMDLLDPLHTDAQIQSFETSNANAAENSAVFPGGVHNNVNAERDFLIRLAVRNSKVAPITGNVARDLRVVDQFNAPSDLWSSILAARNPAAFTD